MKNNDGTTIGNQNLVTKKRYQYHNTPQGWYITINVEDLIWSTFRQHYWVWSFKQDSGLLFIISFKRNTEHMKTPLTKMKSYSRAIIKQWNIMRK